MVAKHEGVTVQVDRATAMRLRRKKAKLDNEQGGPDLTMDLYLNYLMDTEQAVRDGYYSEVISSER